MSNNSRELILLEALEASKAARSSGISSSKVKEAPRAETHSQTFLRTLKISSLEDREGSEEEKDR